MSDRPTAARKAFGHIAPALAEYTDDVLFGDVWERPGLSPRDRSLITVASDRSDHASCLLFGVADGELGVTERHVGAGGAGTIRIDPLFEALQKEKNKKCRSADLVIAT